MRYSTHAIFFDISTCCTCKARMCTECLTSLQRVYDDAMRDRIMTGVINNENQADCRAKTHTCVSDTSCRSGEGARPTGTACQYPSQSTLQNKDRRSSRKRRRQTLPSKILTLRGSPTNAQIVVVQRIHPPKDTQWPPKSATGARKPTIFNQRVEVENQHRNHQAVLDS